ncbi:MAG: Redox-sensing transcriptional repressor rex [Gemmatimonadetes bacterium]|nr:Redox-sensing transcriptional repressor rex [Gemmatimonadota bacterium]
MHVWCMRLGDHCGWCHLSKSASIVKEFTSPVTTLKRIADSTVRRLSIYLRFLEEFGGRGLLTVSSDELARRGGTTSAQVRKDLSFFGSFGKRGLGYSVPELAGALRDILGLGREWKVVIIGAGKIGAALAQYRGFRQRGFVIVAAYDSNPEKIGRTLEGIEIRDMSQFEADVAIEKPEIAVLSIPTEHAQSVLDRVEKAGIKAVLNFAPVQLHAAADTTVKTVNMAMELEGLTFALTNKD